METVAKIRRLHLADRLSIRSITRKTGLSRNTIRKYLRSNEVQPPLSAELSPSFASLG